MIRMFASEASIDFTVSDYVESALTKPETLIPGATMYHADQTSGQFSLQTYSKKNYSLYFSTYAPVRDMTLRAEYPLPFLGFRIMLQNHILHRLNDLVFPIMQGQVNLVYAPHVHSELQLKQNEVYTIFDLRIEEDLLLQLREVDKDQAKLVEDLKGSATVALFNKPDFASMHVLDTLEALLKEPNKEELVLLLLRQVLDARRMKRKGRPVTEQQVENLFRVKAIMKEQLKHNRHLRDWARLSFMSLTYFKEMFKTVFAVSPYQYLLYERIKAAKQLIRSHPELTLSQVATACGFNNDNNLRRAFFSVEKMTLSQWHKMSDLALVLWVLKLFD